MDAPLGYCFHPLNSYDDPETGQVVIDLCFYEKMFDQDRQGPFGDTMARLERWRIDVDRASISRTTIDASPNEFPRHRGSRATKPYRYGYTTSPSADPAAGWPTLKHDLDTGRRTAFDHGPGRAAGEPVFVARPDATDEDDGWIITFVHDLGRASTEFVVLDAQEFERGYVAKVPLPQRVPFGFHGNWASD